MIKVDTAYTVFGLNRLVGKDNDYPQVLKNSNMLKLSWKNDPKIANPKKVF